METKSKQTVVVELVLSATEARWLRDVMQNPIRQNHSPQYVEPEYDKVMRQGFWDVLNRTEGV